MPAAGLGTFAVRSSQRCLQLTHAVLKLLFEQCNGFLVVHCLRNDGFHAGAGLLTELRKVGSVSRDLDSHRQRKRTGQKSDSALHCTCLRTLIA
jgi:hypothetical protein